VSSEEPEVATAELPEEYARLEESVRRVLDQVAEHRAEAREAQDRAEALEETLKGMKTGSLDPVKMREGLRKLESENQELRRRMVQAQDRIRRLVARFDFLREEM